MTTHKLKTLQPWFEEVWDREKRFEIRLNDRDFQVGDRLLLRLYDPETGYGFREIDACIRTVLIDVPGVKDGHVVLQLADMSNYAGSLLCPICEKLIRYGVSSYSDPISCYECMLEQRSE